MISGKFFKSSLIYSVVGALPMLSGFILLPFYTGDILSEKNYGYLTLHLAFGLLFQSVFVFAIDNFVGPVVVESKRDTALLRKKVAAINYYSLLFAGFCVVALFISGPFLFSLGFPGREPMQFYPFICSTVITSVFNAYFKLYCNYLIYTEQARHYLIANVVNFIATLAISIGALYFFGDTIMGPLMGRLLSGAIIFTIAVIYMAKAAGAAPDKVFLKEIVKFCSPLMIFFILNWLFNNADRLFIEKMLTTELVGLFDFGIKCTLGVEVLFTGMNHSVYPKIYGLISEKSSPEKLKEHFNKYASGYLIAIILAVAATLIFAPFAVTLLIKKTFYHKALAFLAILTVGQIFKVLYHLYMGPLLYFKRTDLVARSFLFSTSIQMIVTFLCIYFLGFNGIIIAYMLSKPFQIFFVWLESNRLVHLPLNPVKQIVLPLLLAALVFSLQLIIKDNQALYYNPMIGGLLLAVTAFFYRREIMPFYRSLLKIKA